MWPRIVVDAWPFLSNARLFREQARA